uniref:Uncharacterized protein n=1 Tax=Mesocestoides corti TaxID=53468 RepID=A0A5K3FIB2_MESCO
MPKPSNDGHIRAPTLPDPPLNHRVTPSSRWICVCVLFSSNRRYCSRTFLSRALS